MVTVTETAENDHVYCRFIKFPVVNNYKLNVWQEQYYDCISPRLTQLITTATWSNNRVFDRLRSCLFDGGIH